MLSYDNMKKGALFRAVHISDVTTIINHILSKSKVFQMKVPNPRKLKSGTWFIQLRLGGESIPVSARTKKECIAQAQLIKAEYKAGKRERKKKKPEEQKPPILSEAIDAYIDRRDAVLSPSTIRGYRTIKRTRFFSMMDKRLSELSDSDWQRACNLEAKICSEKTLKNAWGFIASVIVDCGLKKPVVRLPQVPVSERPFLEPEQIRPFIEAVHGTDVEIPALLALSSLRRSEILALRWENIDLEKRLVKVRGAAVLNSENELIQKRENKNRSSARTVPIMIDELYEALKESYQREGLVVTCHPNTTFDRVNKICELNGFPKVGVHGLRHSFVSLAYHLGVPEKIVMEIGGWSDYQTMRRIYTHIAKSDVAKYTNKFRGFFSQNMGEPSKNAN